MTNKMAVQLLGNSQFLLKQEHGRLKVAQENHRHVLVQQAIAEEILETEERICTTAAMLNDVTVERAKEIEAEPDHRINQP